MNLKTCSNQITGDIIQLPVPQRRYSVDNSYNEHTSSLMIQGRIERLKYSLEPLNEEIWSVIDIQISQSTAGGCYNTQFPMSRFVYIVIVKLQNVVLVMICLREIYFCNNILGGLLKIETCNQIHISIKSE